MSNRKNSARDTANLGLLAKVWSLNFYPIDDATARLYREECGSTFRHFSDSDFAAAARWLAHSGDCPPYPKAKDLWRACKELDKKRQEEEQAERILASPSCGMCEDGWLRYWPDMQEPYTYEKTFSEIALAIPCRCTEGEHVRGIVYNEQWPEPKNLGAMRTLAFAQISAVKSAAPDAPAASEDALPF